MASVLIKGMKMPKCEDEGVLIALHDDKAYIISTKETKEAVELPDHGDLIDRDALFDDNSWDWFNEWGSTVNQQARLVADAPVVIPAERSEE